MEADGDGDGGAGNYRRHPIPDTRIGKKLKGESYEIVKSYSILI